MFYTSRIQRLRVPSVLSSLAAAVGLFCSAPQAWAGGAKTVRLATIERFEAGELTGVALESSGKMTVGLQVKGRPIEGVQATLRCNKSGTRTYLGTADKSRLYVLSTDGDAIKPTLISEMPGLGVSALAEMADGSILAAVLPGGTIYRIARDGKPIAFAKLEAERIWDLLVTKDSIYAATGPDGRVFQISLNGKSSKIVFDGEERDAFTLLAVGKKIVVGMAGQARLFEINGETSGQLLQDFEGDEIRALALHNGTLWAAVNRFETRGMSSLNTLTKDLQRASLGGKAPSTDDTAGKAVKGSGRLLRIDLGAKNPDLDRAAEGEWEKVFSRNKVFFSDFLITEDESVLLSTSDSGKIYRIKGLRDNAVIADLGERQASGLCRVGPNGSAIAALTNDGAAVYRLLAGPGTDATFTSEVLDLEGISRLGQIALRGKGKLGLRVRTGPSEKVDKRWSDWQSVALNVSPVEYSGTLKAPTHRWLQLEVKLEAKDSEVRSIEFFHAPHNRAPILRSVGVRAPKFSISDDSAPAGKAAITWSADAQDDDELNYEVSLRAEKGSGGNWISLTKGTPTSQSEFALDLDTLPDGIYEAKVETSDEPDNGSARALRDELVSEPFTVDRTPPTLEKIAQKGQTIEGECSDALSRIHDVMFKVDDGPFRPASPSDGIFDSRAEKFILVVPTLEAGSHRVVVRARDTAGNLRAQALTFVVGPVKASR
jgi:hypothetical protein